jgi:hypothetical protein
MQKASMEPVVFTEGSKLFQSRIVREKELPYISLPAESWRYFRAPLALLSVSESVGVDFIMRDLVERDEPKCFSAVSKDIPL